MAVYTGVFITWSTEFEEVLWGHGSPCPLILCLTWHHHPLDSSRLKPKNFLELLLHTFYGGDLVSKLCPTLVTPRTVAPQALCPWDFPGQNTGVEFPSPLPLPHNKLSTTLGCNSEVLKGVQGGILFIKPTFLFLDTPSFSNVSIDEGCNNQMGHRILRGHY